MPVPQPPPEQGDLTPTHLPRAGGAPPPNGVLLGPPHSMGSGTPAQPQAEMPPPAPDISPSASPPVPGVLPPHRRAAQLAQAGTWLRAGGGVCYLPSMFNSWGGGSPAAGAPLAVPQPFGIPVPHSGRCWGLPCPPILTPAGQRGWSGAQGGGLTPLPHIPAAARELSAPFAPASNCFDRAIPHPSGFCWSCPAVPVWSPE